MAITSLIGIQTAPVFRRSVVISGNTADGGIPRYAPGTTFTLPPNPPESKLYLSNVNTGSLSIAGVSDGNFIVMDLIWSVTLSNSTSLQTITTPDIGNRDRNGTQRGDGVYAMITTSANRTGSLTTLSVNYTSSSGNSDKVGTSMAFQSPGAGRSFFIGLANGDEGVRSVQSAQFSALPGGTMDLIGVRPISVICTPMVISGNGQADAISLGLPEIYNGSNIIIFYNVTARVTGQMDFIYG